MNYRTNTQYKPINSKTFSKESKLAHNLKCVIAGTLFTGAIVGGTLYSMSISPLFQKTKYEMQQETHNIESKTDSLQTVQLE